MIFVKLNGNWVHYIRKKTYCQPSVYKKVNNIFFIRYQGQKVRKPMQACLQVCFLFFNEKN